VGADVTLSTNCAGTRAESGAAALELAVQNLRRLHRYALGLVEDVKRRGIDIEIVSSEDLRLLEGLQQALERMATAASQ
jgi:hypothetical protein